MTRPEKKGLPASVRERLRVEVRAALVRHGKSAAIGEILAEVITSVGKETRTKELSALATSKVGGRRLDVALGRWVAELPPTERSEALVSRLSKEAGLRWAAEAKLEAGPLRIPAVERERIERRFERIWTRSIDRHDDEGELAEYADALDDELGRIGHKHEQLALRVLHARFPDASGERTLTLRDYVDRVDPASHVELLRLVERALEIEWVGDAPAARAETAHVAAPVSDLPAIERPYDPAQSYVVGERVLHARFGAGLVVGSEPGRVVIRFESGDRKLAQRV